MSQIEKKVADLIFQYATENEGLLAYLRERGITPFFLANYFEDLSDIVGEAIDWLASIGEFYRPRCQNYYGMHAMAMVKIRMNRDDGPGEGICGGCLQAIERRDWHEYSNRDQVG